MRLRGSTLAPIDAPRCSQATAPAINEWWPRR